MREIYTKNLHRYSIEAKFLKVESMQIIRTITDSSVITIRKHLVDLPMDKLSKVPSDSITGCLNRLLGADDDSQEEVINEDDASVRKIVKLLVDDSLRYIRHTEIAELSDFSNEENFITEQPPNLLLAMLTVEGKKCNSADYVRTYLNDILSESESEYKNMYALQSSDENGYVQSLAHCFTCAAYFLLLRRYWPIEMIQSHKPAAVFALRLLKVSLGTSLGAIFLSPIVFEIIKKQAEITRTHQNKSADVITSKRPEKEQPREHPSDINDNGFAIYQLPTPWRVGPSVMDYKQDVNLFFNWKSCLREEFIFRVLLFRSLLGYVHPALACLLCTISSTLSYDSFYSDIYNGLDVNHARGLKFVESFLLTSLSYVSNSVIPCLWVKALLSWDSTDFHTLGDPLLNRGLIMEKVFTFFNRVGLKSLPSQRLANSDNIAKDSLEQLAEAVMSEYSSPFNSYIDPARRKLTMEEREDFICTLEWACSNEVVTAMAQDEERTRSLLPSTPLNYLSHLGSPVNYCQGPILLNLLTPPNASNSQLAELWALAMEKIILGGSSSAATAVARRSGRSDSCDGPDVDPMYSNSREFIVSQFQVRSRRRFDHANEITQSQVEALLLSALSDSSASVPTSTLLPSLAHSLFHASNMDSDAFLRLMRDKYAFANQIFDYYAPRINCELAKFYYHRCPAGVRLSNDDHMEVLRGVWLTLMTVQATADDIFLRSRGLTGRRYQALLNKHSLNPEVKALHKELEKLESQKRKYRAQFFCTH